MKKKSKKSSTSDTEEKPKTIESASESEEKLRRKKRLTLNALIATSVLLVVAAGGIYLVQTGFWTDGSSSDTEVELLPPATDDELITELPQSEQPDDLQLENQAVVNNNQQDGVIIDNAGFAPMFALVVVDRGIQIQNTLEKSCQLAFKSLDSDSVVLNDNLSSGSQEVYAINTIGDYLVSCTNIEEMNELNLSIVESL